MGILTLLRNAFGRGRKSRSAEAESASQPLSHEVPTPQLPEPRSEDPTPGSEEHDLVTAAFDNITVPRQTDPERDRPTKLEVEPAAEVEAAAEAERVAETEPEAEAEVKPTAEAEAEPAAEAEPVAEAEADAAAPLTAEAEQETKPAAERVAETEPEAEAEVKPTAEAEAEPAAEPETEAAPEPVTAAEPEAKVELDALPEPEAAVEPEPTVEPEATVEPEVEAQPVTEAEPRPEVEVEPVTEVEPVAETETESTVATTDDAAAADGEDAPQGPPAADNETRTGAAGGNETDAEGEAEAATSPAPTPEAEAEPTDTLGPATPLTRLTSRTPSLTTAYNAATTTLEKTNLTGTRAKLYLVLDRSASMRPYYKDGSAQALADQTLALAAHLDPEATVHVVFFSTEVDGTTDLTLTPDHETKIDDVHAGLGRMGRTSYHAAVEAVLAHHEKSADATPALVIFQTDGAPDAKTPATQSLTEAAKNHPTVFFSFVAFGEYDNKAFDYLRKLKTGNTSFFHAGPAPRELTDTELYEGVLAIWRP
ncbi:VWA domain-containing protein [Streptomyces sp. NPDC002520]